MDEVYDQQYKMGNEEEQKEEGEEENTSWCLSRSEARLNPRIKKVEVSVVACSFCFGYIKARGTSRRFVLVS